MSKGLQYLLIASSAVLLFASLVSGKTIGVKDGEDGDLKKSEDMMLNNPEYGTEAALATAQLLAQDYEDSLKEAEMESNLATLEELEHELEDLSTATETSLKTSTDHHRSKRTIGFLTRLGSCIMTFMSNPTCWSRLTRNQIQREEQRQLQLLQQEQEKQMLEQQIYESYSNNLLNGTEGINGTSNGNGTSTPIQKRPRTKMTTTTTTARPKLFPIVGRLTQGVSRLFPRLFGFLNPNGADNSSPSLISQFASSRSSASSSSTPGFRIHALQNA